MKKAWIEVHVSQPVIYLHVLQPGEFINKTWEQLKWGMELDHEINYKYYNISFSLNNLSFVVITYPFKK